MKDKIAKKLLGSERIVISSHIRPDGDSIGSGLALSLMLKQLGKQVSFRNKEMASFPLTKLPGYDIIEYSQIYPENFDAVVLIESGNEDRSGMKNMERYFTINIDHHATSPRISDINWVDPKASAVGELIYELGEHMKIRFTPEIGANLYAAIISDTGSFKYSNTTFRTLKTASEIVSKSGINPHRISDLIFNSNPPEKIFLLRKILSTLELSKEGCIASISFIRDFMPLGDGIEKYETEDIIAIVRSIIGVKVTIFFKEVDKNYFRVSLRSKGDVSSFEIAKNFNGGGHNHASGFFMKGEYETVKKSVLETAEEYLDLINKN